MRRAIFIAVLGGLVLSGAALAQMTEFTSNEHKFSINFPAPPTQSTTTYTIAGGKTVPAALFTAERRGARYTVHVVALPDDSPDRAEQIKFAAESFRKRGWQVVHDELSVTDGIPVHQMTLVAPDGRRSMFAIMVWMRRLYITEGNVPEGAPPPTQFQQGVFVLDAQNEKVRVERAEYERLNPR
jgi:hypothetical protein